jgi:serine/threonine-protein kinase
MATVYLAHEIALDRKVAIKVMAPALTLGPGMLERFKREARTAANLSHPNIIPVYAVREAGELLFFVMKLVEGTPLDSIMRELGKLPVPMVEAILAQVGGAFGYAHRRGVIHRDIKPSNILIDEEGWAVVTDFGIAKVAESEGLTQTGTAVGTPTYMSPEQCSSAPLDGRSDQYSLGVVAYEMLAGHPPFSGPTMALMYGHCHGTAPALLQERPDCPPTLAAAVMRMLEKDPSARWPSMEDAVVGLGARQLAHDDPTRSQLILLARSGVTHKIVSQVQTPRSPIPLTASRAVAAVAGARAPRRYGPALAALAVVIVVLGVGAAVVLRPKPTAPVATPAAAPPLAAPAPAPTPAPAPSPVEGRQRASANGAQTRVEATPPKGTTLPGRSPEPKPEVPSAAPAPAPSPPPPPPPAASQLPQQAPVTIPPREVAGSSAATLPASPADAKAPISATILGYARALEAGDLAQARRLYPGMPADQQQGLEAFWKAGGTMRPVWSVSDVQVNGDTATARVEGSTSVRTHEGTSQQRVSLRARLERRGSEWRLVALVN